MKPLDLAGCLLVIFLALWPFKAAYVDPYLDPACIQGIPGDYKPN